MQNNNNNVEIKVFSQDAFKSEVKDAAAAHRDTAGYIYEEHKRVAEDAAAMALSKSESFAKAFEGESGEGLRSMRFEGIRSMSMMRTGREFGRVWERMGDTWSHSRATFGVMGEILKLGFVEAKKELSKAFVAAKEDTIDFSRDAKRMSIETYEYSRNQSMRAWSFMRGTMGSWFNRSKTMAVAAEGEIEKKTSSAMGYVEEKINVVEEKIEMKTGEALEAIGEKIVGAGQNFEKMALDTKAAGIKMQKEAELTQTKLNLTPIPMGV